MGQTIKKIWTVNNATTVFLILRLLILQLNIFWFRFFAEKRLRKADKNSSKEKKLLRDSAIIL